MARHPLTLSPLHPQSYPTGVTPSRPIVILGFGRSGTTWLSDVVSKVLGGLLLFEPLHPQVCDFAAEVCYAPSPALIGAQRLHDHLGAAMTAVCRHRWLLRNHLFTPLEDVSQSYIDMVWNECPVIGFKEIRANFLIDWLIEQFDARIVFLLRHPCSVLASLRRRANFWNEFGWEQHYRMFHARVIDGWPAASALIAPHRAAIAAARTELDQQTVMWALTALLAAWQLEQHDLPLFCYEDFYDQPFAATRNLMAYLGEGSPSMHPAHLFVPSMTTLRTTHGLVKAETDYASHGERLFWQDVLTDAEVGRIMGIVESMGLDRWYTL